MIGKADLKDYTVLIAEDEEVNFVYIKTVLNRTGIKIIRAKNGREAVEICEKDKSIDIVLMDIRMPLMNGYEATRLIKDRFPHLPIVALTAYAFEENKEKAMNAGCDGYFTKPVSPTQIYKIIENLNLN